MQEHNTAANIHSILAITPNKHAYETNKQTALICCLLYVQLFKEETKIQVQQMKLRNLNQDLRRKQLNHPFVTPPFINLTILLVVHKQ
jgi:hypothetical protein